MPADTLSRITEADRTRWTAALTQIAKQPLEFCPNFPEIAARWEAWWRFESDRPLLQISASKREIPYWGKAFHLFPDFEAWFEARFPQVDAVQNMGESVPALRVDIGPVSLGAFIGAPLTLSEKTGTTWQMPIVESWDDFEPCLDPENEWWKTVREFTARLAERAANRFLVTTPDLTGAIDTLANLRHSEQLCFDLYEDREGVIRSAEKVMGIFETVYKTLADSTLQAGAGMNQWTGGWSSSPYCTPTCDFNALIGTQDFAQVCMPSLRAQSQAVGRITFHLDGPDAARHAETLAADPAITSIQFVPGTATPSALAQTEMFRRIQAHRKPVMILIEFAEAEKAMETFDPRGTSLCVYNCPGAREAERLVARRDELFG